jgi:hypothetical protein
MQESGNEALLMDAKGAKALKTRIDTEQVRPTPAKSST